MTRIHILSAAALLGLASIGTALASPAGNHAVMARVAWHQTQTSPQGYIHVVLHPYDGDAAPRS